jgi:uncharacterized protein
MALTASLMDRKIDEHFGFEARDDVEGVLATMAPTRGRNGARAFYETLFADLSDGKVSCVRRLYGKDFLVDESLWRGKAPGKPFGLEGRGRPLEFRLLHVIEFTGEGAIARENVWLDLAAIMRQLPQD